MTNDSDARADDIEFFTTVRLTCIVDGHPMGTMGVVVHRHEDGDGFEIEIVPVKEDGEPDVITATRQQIETIQINDQR